MIRTSSSRPPYVLGFERMFVVVDDGKGLEYDFKMSTETDPEMKDHLVCKLVRQ